MEESGGSPAAVAEYLASLYRTVSQALALPAPLNEVLLRLKRAIDASVVVIDHTGRTVAATATLPITTLHGALDPTGPAVQILDIDGWRGVGVAVESVEPGSGRFGWLIAASRRAGFPDARAVSAVQVAVSLVEVARRIEGVERMQERIVRTALVEQAIELRSSPADPELTARMTSFGLRFGEELRVVVARVGGPATGRPTRADETADALARVLRAAGVVEFTSARGDHVVVLAQCGPGTVRRLLAADGVSNRLLIGVGRPIAHVGQIADSYHDARLAVRTVAPRDRPRSFVAYEDFDFATRLFADVGLDRMSAWAEELLRPLDGKDLLLDALRAYFEHHQDVKAAAGVLFIHHNSMRYRLAKVAQSLGVDLRDPRAIASIYLALTALDLAGTSAPSRPAAGPGRATHPPDERAAGVTAFREPDGGEWGVAFVPDG